MKGEREFWGSRTSFLLAAIGSAIGLGNLWRFPYVCYANGGGAFLVAYFLCLFIAGIPLLMLEFGIGHYHQKASPGSFRKIHPTLEWFGWFAVGVGFIIVTYYAVIMTYCANYTVHSLTLAWGDDPAGFFNNTFLGITDSSDPANTWKVGGFRAPLLIGFIISWIFVVAAIWKGTKTVGKVVYVTVLVPWALLILFTIRGMTLPGAGIGLSYYLKPVWGKLLDPQLWLAAITQVFFSLTVGFGVMIAYGSFLPKKSDIVQNAFIIGIADVLTAFVGGLAVFGALGHKAYIDGVSIDKVVQAGPGLTFVTYPEIISNLPFPRLFGVLFFIMLLTLAVDSAFSLLEAVTSSFKDKFGWSHKRANLTLGALAFLMGLPLLTGAGLHWLDITDRFMNQFGLTLVVLGECLIAALVFGLPKLRDFLDRISYWKTSKIGIITFCVSVIMFVFAVLHINHVRTPLIVTGVLAVVFIEVFTMLIYYKSCKIRDYFHSKLWYLFSYFWDICVLVMTPIGIVLMLIFEISARIKQPYGDFANRGQEFVFGWLVLILIIFAGIVLSFIRNKNSQDVEICE
ncbi:MAG: sodium-dependent transporter [Candidatus Zixiibacteriota bacterium]